MAKLYNNSYSILWFASIAFISLGLKLLLIYKVSRFFYWSLALYLVYFFVLFDGTVIRISLAIIIAYWGAWFFSNQTLYSCIRVIDNFQQVGFITHWPFLVWLYFLIGEVRSIVLVILYPL